MAGRAFWDASAIVALLAKQESTPKASELGRRFGNVVVWWGTTVEVRSAIAKRVRQKLMTKGDAEQSLRRFRALRTRWAEVEPLERIRSDAEEYPDRFGLRAGDALQLAAALAWCSNRPKNRPFVSFDNDLADAAQEVGFEVHRV